MAAVVKKLFSNKKLFNSSIFTRHTSNQKQAHVVMTDDSSVVVCWHPETFFPYEHSLPIPKKVTSETNSLLKVQSSKDLLSILIPKKEEIVRQELMALTHTVKHIWFPPKFQFRKKPRVRPDRPYL